MRLPTRASSELAMPLALALASCFSPAGSDGSTGPSTTEPPPGSSTAVVTTGIPTTTGMGTTGTTDQETVADVSTGSSTSSTSSASSTSSSSSTVTTTGTDGVCGDATLDAPGEQCDDGTNNAENAPCTLACQHNVCGDAQPCPACDEECDDGNQVAGDGCSTQCTQEHLFIFVTSTPKVGKEIGGVAGADLFCNQLAKDKFHPSRKFIAWMTVGPPMSERIGITTLRFVAPLSLTKIASGTNGLVLSKLEAPILTTETGAVLVPLGDCTETSSVWTGVKNGGVPDANTCNDWSAMGPLGLAGELGATDGKWTEECALTCGFSLPIYCVETTL